MRVQILAAGLLLAVMALPRAQHRPNVLLVTLDTVRADRMGFLGSTRGLTPQLDAFARSSIVFTRAYSQAPVTTVSHATILTGTYPPFHQVTDFGAPLPPDVPYVPELLRRAGYRTAAFVGSLVLDPRAGTAPGFDRGFDTYDAGFRLRQPGDDRYQTVERRGDEVTARARRWIASAGPGSWFVWVHLFDAHDPYDAPSDLKRRFPAAPYDGEVASVDRLAGELVRAVDSDALVVIAADHGEALGDHGEDTHGVFLYDATLRVPLLVRMPERRAARIDARVRLADVAPTIVEAVGLPVPPAMQGESLVRLTDDRPVYSETEYPRRAFGWSPLVAWRADRFLFVRAPRRELYDEVADPDATRNLAAARARVADGLDAELKQFMQRTTGAAGRTMQPAVDPALAERLAALGYVGGSLSSTPAVGVDPKDRIKVANTLHIAILAVEDGAFQKAIPLLEQVVAREPTIHIAQLNLGVARARQRQYARAIAPLGKAIALQPDVMIAHYELGVALYETGDLKTAAGHFQIVASRLPKWADARYSLASVYARIDRVSDATAELRAALAQEPRHFRANLLLGRILTLQGQAAAAVEHLRTATAVQPTSAEALQFLADAYEKSGRPAEAAEARRRAGELTRR